MNRLTDRYRMVATGTAVTLVLGTLWWSFVQAPLMSDDVVFQSLARSGGRSILQSMGGEIESFLRSGRMNLLNPAQAGFLFQLDPPLWAYRAFQFGLVCLALAALWAA